mmetsp:Transcript_27239/g.68385  ORF Transcript_27239/g.68385 Transcript_27239/m.68385 type:complete len:316 (-) Transcript_27239:283-1230(-)
MSISRSTKLMDGWMGESGETVVGADWPACACGCDTVATVGVAIVEARDSRADWQGAWGLDTDCERPVGSSTLKVVRFRKRDPPWVMGELSLGLARRCSCSFRRISSSDRALHSLPRGFFATSSSLSAGRAPSVSGSSVMALLNSTSCLMFCRSSMSAGTAVMLLHDMSRHSRDAGSCAALNAFILLLRMRRSSRHTSSLMHAGTSSMALWDRSTTSSMVMVSMKRGRVVSMLPARYSWSSSDTCVRLAGTCDRRESQWYSCRSDTRRDMSLGYCWMPFTEMSRCSRLVRLQISGGKVENALSVRERLRRRTNVPR